MPMAQDDFEDLCHLLRWVAERAFFSAHSHMKAFRFDDQFGLGMRGGPFVIKPPDSAVQP